MSFRLWTIFYAFALLAAAMATFGIWGSALVVPIVGFWAYHRKHGYTPTIWFSVGVSALPLPLWALLDPAMHAAQDGADRGRCIWRLHRLALGALRYSDTVKTLPPAYVVDAFGKPMHSWRLLIDPYIDFGPFVPAYSMNEPWDGPQNYKLATPRPECYCCPNHEDQHPTQTSYFAVVGPETALTPIVGRNPNTITDGAGNTIMLIEASDQHINWMEPRDLTIDEAVELLTTRTRSGHFQITDGLLTTTYHETSGRYVAFCDGHFSFLPQLKDPAIARALLTVAGGETIPEDLDRLAGQQYVEPVTTTVIKWGRIWGLCLFAFLALLPLGWVPRRTSNSGPYFPPDA